MPRRSTVWARSSENTLLVQRVDPAVVLVAHRYVPSLRANAESAAASSIANIIVTTTSRFFMKPPLASLVNHVQTVEY